MLSPLYGAGFGVVLLLFLLLALIAPVALYLFVDREAESERTAGLNWENAERAARRDTRDGETPDGGRPANDERDTVDGYGWADERER